ncbi:MAG: NAD-dependent epimerase/dehydratase family protein [Prevotellaceae bacterium]|nr:NAD-dependent epimerase/dehydratase family protein [Prevotellaceae bacterium]
MATILICGHRAYAARGLKQLFVENGHNVVEFSRGDVMRDGNVVTGPVSEIDKNPLLTEDINVVINFILLQNGTVEENEDYFNALLRFSSTHGVKRLIQISSISSYPNDAPLITEDTPTEKNVKLKGAYGIIKAAADNLLERKRNKVDFDIIFVRPGYIIAADHPHPFAGIAKFVTSKLAILIGDKKATLPCVRREVLHRCLAEIAVQENPLQVYLLVEGKGGTKYSYFRTLSNAVVIPLPKCLFFIASDVLKVLHIFNQRHVGMVKGAFKVNRFDNSKTRNKLKSLQ